MAISIHLWDRCLPNPDQNGMGLTRAVLGQLSSLICVDHAARSWLERSICD